MNTRASRKALDPARRGRGRSARRPGWAAVRLQGGEFSARTVESFLGEIASRERLRQLDRRGRQLDRRIHRILSLSARRARAPVPVVSSSPPPGGAARS